MIILTRNRLESAGRSRIKERGLEVVKIDDAELDRLRSQVSRIATRLEATDGTQHDKSFGVDSITVHVGLSASGHFYSSWQAPE